MKESQKISRDGCIFFLVIVDVIFLLFINFEITLLVNIFIAILIIVVSSFGKFKKRRETKPKIYIVRTTIVATDSKKDSLSSATRGAVGTAVGGVVGGMVGVATAKNNNKTTFLIEYSNGEKETITVNNNSPYFEKYCNYLDK